MVDLTKNDTRFSILGDFSREQEKFPIFFMKYTTKPLVAYFLLCDRLYENVALYGAISSFYL